ncbi:MAG: hypothetical protein IKE76_09505 [Clostridia bacterium]|nr:hypothetical protein [Clostridia bacterium]
MAAETQRCSWEDVWKGTALEMLNVLAYRRDLDAEKDRQVEMWKKSH